MIIEKTNVVDITDNIKVDELKINLADKIIKEIYPIFDTLFVEKTLELKEIHSKYTKIKKEVKDKSLVIKNLLLEKNLLELQNKVLLRLEKLFSLNLINFDDMYLNEVKELLKDDSRFNDENELKSILDKSLEVLKRRIQ